MCGILWEKFYIKSLLTFIVVRQQQVTKPRKTGCWKLKFPVIPELYLSYLDTRKCLVGWSCLPMGFNVTSELKWIHICTTFLNRKLHNERRQTLATEERHTFWISEMFWLKPFSRKRQQTISWIRNLFNKNQNQKNLQVYSLSYGNKSKDSWGLLQEDLSKSQPTCRSRTLSTLNCPGTPSAEHTRSTLVALSTLNYPGTPGAWAHPLHPRGRTVLPKEQPPSTLAGVTSQQEGRKQTPRSAFPQVALGTVVSGEAAW